MKQWSQDLTVNINDELLNSYPASASLQHAIYVERIKMLYSGIQTIVSASLIGMTMLMYVNWHLIPRGIMFTWFGYMTLVLIYRITLSHLFHKSIEHDQSNPQAWARLYLLGTVLMAIGWGVAGSLLISQDSILQQMFTIILLAGLTAGALSTLTAIYTVYLVFLLVTMVPLLIRLYSFGDDLHIATATLVLLFILFILGSARRMVNTVTKSISLRFMHDDALRNIAEQKQQTDTLNENLRKQINEREIVEQHLENSMSQLKATLESATDGILVVDNHDIITNFNCSFIELFQVPEDIIEPNDYGQIEQYIKSQLKNPDIDSLRPTQDVLLLELNDNRLIEVFWNPQRVGELTIGGVYSFRDATARIHSEASLQRAKNEAIEASKAKSDFLSRVSHELRTPLNAILGFGNLLNQDDRKHLETEEKDYVANIINAGEHLLHLIDELLDISQIESGKLNIQLLSIPAKNIVDESITLVGPSAELNQVSLKVDSDLTSIPNVLADQTRCKQALVNLLSNAIKYNHKGGAVTLKLSSDDHHVRFEVHDTGPGIDKDKHAEIFQPFTRLKQTEKKQGTGIGLTITRRLIDIMNGRIGVSSEPGQGSLFWFELPIAPEDTPQPDISELDISRENHIQMEKQHTILYIEDEPLNQALVRSIVKQIPNTELITALTGEEGVDVAKAEQPDLILMDLNLPGISGYEAMALLKQDARFSNTPVFAVSANAMPDEISRGKQAGFYDYLIKPINIDNTRALLSNTLSELEKQ